MKVKGTVIVDLVRIIRSQKNIDWSKYLKPEDFEIVKSLVVASKWYPGDSFWRLSFAVTKEIAKMQLDMTFDFGRLSAKSFLKVYKRLMVKGNPAASLENCINLWDSFYNQTFIEDRKSVV